VLIGVGSDGRLVVQEGRREEQDAVPDMPDKPR
jgi:hypothetical protein